MILKKIGVLYVMLLLTLNVWGMESKDKEKSLVALSSRSSSQSYFGMACDGLMSVAEKLNKNLYGHKAFVESRLKKGTFVKSEDDLNLEELVDAQHDIDRSILATTKETVALLKQQDGPQINLKKYLDDLHKKMPKEDSFNINEAPYMALKGYVKSGTDQLIKEAVNLAMVAYRIETLKKRSNSHCGKGDLAEIEAVREKIEADARARFSELMEVFITVSCKAARSGRFEMKLSTISNTDADKTDQSSIVVDLCEQGAADNQRSNALSLSNTTFVQSGGASLGEEKKVQEKQGKKK